jgi:serine/threonine protein kinase/Tfp pilus assembly protein PilF
VLHREPLASRSRLTLGAGAVWYGQPNLANIGLTAMTLAAGTHLGRYEIRSLLGRGGMGEVYRAHDTQLERLVALKILPAEFATNQERMRRFVQEAKAASALNHPNILTIYEVGQTDSAHFIVTEFIEGATLRQCLTRGRRSLREVLEVGIQVASALAAAHQAGIIHRDIKPENLMVRPDGYVKVLDFGLAKLTEQPTPSIDTEAATLARIATDPGVVVGTAAYMSPEQLRGLALDTRTDIWSLGVVLYEMLAGRRPFDAGTRSDLIVSILEREPPAFAVAIPGAQKELERIVRKALRKDREERYQAAKDLALDLKDLRQELELEAQRERSIPPAASGAATAGTHGAVATSSGPTRVQTDEAGTARQTSSAEYLVSEISRHKTGAGLVLAALVIALAAAAYFTSFAPRAQTIMSVAVLPFANGSGDPSLEYLSDGLSESLIDQLSQLPQLKVIARSSSFKYKGQETDPQEVARVLGVQALITGRVVQRGDSLTVRAELVDAREGTQLWGEQYNRKAADLLAVQEEIARTVAETLRVRLTGAQEQQLAKRPTENPQAYQLYLDGRFYGRQGGSENLKKAFDHYNQAVALDPNFALAWTWIARSYASFIDGGELDPRAGLPKMKAAVARALELDETLAEAHVFLALIRVYEWDWAGAEREYKRALELNPNLALAHHAYASYLSQFTERHAEALAENKRAQELDPLSRGYRAAEGHHLTEAGRVDEAIAHLQHVVRVDPENIGARFWLARAYERKGMYAQAIAEYQQPSSIPGESPPAGQCHQVYALARAGRRSEALAILDKLKTTGAYVPPVKLAYAYVGLDDRERALALLEEAYEAHDPTMGDIGLKEFRDSLGSDPRYVELVRKVGLTP